MQIHALVLAALACEAALAQPAHRHTHQHKRGLGEVLGKRWGTPKGGWNDDSNYVGVDWNKAYDEGTKEQGGDGGDQSSGTPSVSSSPSQTADQSGPTSHAATSSSSSSNDGDSKSTSKSSSDGDSSSSSSSNSSGGSGSCSNLADFGLQNSKFKRATYEQDTYVGNTGGSKWGSNIKPEPSCEPSGEYSLTFVNNMSSKKEFLIWDKIGEDGTMDGMMKPALSFWLEDGQKAVFSIESNSQVGFSINEGRAAANGGVPNCNIGELNIDDQNSHGGSAYDVSLVTLNDIKKNGGSPNEYPLKISAPGYSESTNSNCVYTDSSQNSPVQPGADGKCAMGPIDSSSFHVTAVFG